MEDFKPNNFPQRCPVEYQTPVFPGFWKKPFYGKWIRAKLDIL
jgi:hypothetical protein